MLVLENVSTTIAGIQVLRGITTKFAIQGMTHQLTMDGRKHNIVASIIHPGATLSSFSTRPEAGRGSV